MGDEELSPFRQLVSDDNLCVFLDLEYFGEKHNVQGNIVRCVVDDDIYGKAEVARDHGVTDSSFTLFVRECDVERQLEGTQLEYDEMLYTVLDWRTDEGMHRITLRKIAAY